MSRMTSDRNEAPASLSWQARFLALLPALQFQARRLIRRSNALDPEEALQAVIASAAVTYARLVKLGQADKAFPTALARFGFQHHQTGRLVGGSVNCRDVGSTKCRLQNACAPESLEGWRETLVETRRSTPAEIAALRIDFGDWLQSLASRSRQLAILLAQGETTQGAAKILGISAGRISQLRRELFASWQKFIGEPSTALA